MKKTEYIIGIILGIILLLTTCHITTEDRTSVYADDLETEIKKMVNEYAKVKLTTDISDLTDNQKSLLPLLFEAAKIMNDIYWKQSFGQKDTLISRIKSKAIRDYVMINYGPWDRLRGNEPFIDTFGEKPAGANFYPADMTKTEFKALVDPGKTSLYTLIRRNDKGALYTVPYHTAFKSEVTKASELIKEAVSLADDPGLKKYLELRAQALLTDNYFESDMAWMDMKNNRIEFIIGPIETYEDQLYGYKAAYESFILIKDQEWSERLAKYAYLLPILQKSLPVEAKYKLEKPGSNSDLNVYDAIYYAGDCNAGSKTIAINLPNDEKVSALKGTRKLQLKNAIKAKFEKILIPISDITIAENQRKHIKFDAFFENIMFHETAHGLGIKNTITGKGTVREALKEYYTIIEEGKADIVGLFLVTRLYEMGEFPDKDLMDNYVTFMAGIFRSVRFGASSSHGKANMIRFNYFRDKGAFTSDSVTNTYSIDFDKMKEAMISLSNEILVIQGDGDYKKAKAMVEGKSMVPEQLKNDLKRIEEAGIPRDIIFEQGMEVMGL